MYDNYNYPAGADNELAPWNQSDPEYMEFDVLVSQTLSKSVPVLTDDYEPEYCEEDGHIYPHTEDTCWEEVYEEDHYTPLQLINLFKRYLESELNHTETVSKQPSFLKHLISECSDWNEDETEIIKD